MPLKIATTIPSRHTALGLGEDTSIGDTNS